MQGLKESREMTIKTLVDRQTGVANVILSRPDKLNVYMPYDMISDKSYTD